MSGLTRKKFAGSPALMAFACRVGFPASPEFEFVPAGVNGFESYLDSGLMKLELLQLDEVYSVWSPARSLGIPLKNAR
jgi:hypothetical protein